MKEKVTTRQLYFRPLEGLELIIQPKDGPLSARYQVEAEELGAFAHFEVYVQQAQAILGCNRCPLRERNKRKVGEVKVGAQTYDVRGNCWAFDQLKGEVGEGMRKFESERKGHDESDGLHTHATFSLTSPSTDKVGKPACFTDSQLDGVMEQLSKPIE